MIGVVFYLPELIILISLSLITLLDLYINTENKKISYYLLQLSLVICSLFLYSSLSSSINEDVTVYELSYFTIFFKLFVLICLILIFHYSYISLSL